MITSSRRLMGASLALALACHAALGWGLMAGGEVEIEGGAGAQETRLGTSFADMVAGTMAADEVGDVTPVVAPVAPMPPDTPQQAEPAEGTEPPQPAAPAAPAPEMAKTPPIDMARATPPEAAVTPNPVQAETPPPTLANPVLPADKLAPDAIATLSALAPRPPQAEAAPLPALAPQPPTDRVQAEADAQAQAAITRSRRPMMRSAAFEKAHAVAAPPKSAQPAQPAKAKEKTKRGTAQQNATAGTASGNQAERATSSGAGQGPSQASGNAAASNYPGLVMRKISRVPRPSVGSKGTAVVAFSVSASGGLADVRIARSSGSSGLDRAALRMVQRAAPFPPPPRGAQRSFSISVKGR